MKNYSADFKENIVKKLLNSGKSLYQFSREEGVPTSTLYLWKTKNKGLNMDSPNSSTFSLQHKFQLLLKAQSLKDAELGEFLRKNGLYSHHLQEFQLDISRFLNTPQKQTSSHKKELNEVKKELHRKEKALLEASALLLLKKKLEDYYVEDEAKNSL